MRNLSAPIPADIERHKFESLTQREFFDLDGRVVSVTLAWSWRLADATPELRQRFKIIGDGIGVYWPDVDEDVSLEGMLFGLPASACPFAMRRGRRGRP